MNIALLLIGCSLLLAALIGGGFDIIGLKFPTVSSRMPRLILFIFGSAALAGSFLNGPPINRTLVAPSPKGIISPPNPLATAALARRPKASADPNEALVLVGVGDKAWFLDTSGSTTDHSFRQAAVLSLSLEEIPRGLLPKKLIPHQVQAGSSACINVFANAYDLSGPSAACFRTNEGKHGAESWGWTMTPKSFSSGSQPIAISLTIYSDDPSPTQIPLAQTTRYFTINVIRNLYDQYQGLFSAFLTVAGALLGLFIKAALDRLWPSGKHE